MAALKGHRRGVWAKEGTEGLTENPPNLRGAALCQAVQLSDAQFKNRSTHLCNEYLRESYVQGTLRDAEIIKLDSSLFIFPFLIQYT